MTPIAFTVPGEPQGKGRARVGAVGGRARLFTPAKTVAYESLVRLAAAEAMGPASPLSGPLAVEIEAIHTVPASWSRKRRQQAIAGTLRPTVKPDYDNIAKAIGDAGNAVLWHDDRQIVRCLTVKRYGERAEVRVRVSACDETPRQESQA